MYYIELDNPEALLKEHLSGFKHLSINSKSNNNFVKFLSENLNDILIGSPNRHLEIIDSFYKCILEEIKEVPLSSCCDFETMRISKVVRNKKEVTDLQFELVWPEPLKLLRSEILKKLNGNSRKNNVWNIFYNLSMPLKNLITNYGELLKNKEDLVNYKSQTKEFWNRELLTIEASKIDLSFKNDLIEFYKTCENKFNYTRFQTKNMNSWNAYQLCKSVAPRICPYCNRNYTPVIYSPDTNFCRPELDHFIPKSLYPMFAVSFYNLIPSCHSCNHNKQDLDVITRNVSGCLTFMIRHPYVKEDDVSTRMIFSIKNSQDIISQLINNNAITDVTIDLEPDLEISILFSLESFRLSFKEKGENQGFYHHHDKEISDSLRLIYNYPKTAINQINILLSKDSDSRTNNLLSLQMQLLSQVIPNSCKSESLGKLKTDCLRGIVNDWLRTSNHFERK
ncbi:hypothetical protein QNZ92_003473 [Vibrio parahaemolyticus]|nr:hypothetical protein [Vibrio parahaemolyticus]